MGKILIMLLSVLLSLTGCGNRTPNIEQMKQSEGIMLEADCYSWDLVDYESDFWSFDSFEVFYDGSVHVVVGYHLSGAVVDEWTVLSDEDYERLASILIHDFATGRCDRKVDACDGSGWTITYYDTDGQIIHQRDSEYIYGIEPLEEMADILRNYIPEYESPPLYN